MAKKVISAPSAEAAIAKMGSKGLNIWDKTWAYTFAFIPLIGFLIFSIAPIILSLMAMFTNTDINTFDSFTWNNFEGFRMVFDASYTRDSAIPIGDMFLQSVWVTIWIASTQLVTLLIALIMSIVLSQKLKGSKVFQVLYFIPYICSSVAVALMWKWVFNTDHGILNSIFGTNIDWLGDPDIVTWCIIVVTIWSAPAYGIVMYRAAIGNINSSLYEAAELDGANIFQKAWHVTIPGIAPTTFYLLMAGISAGLLCFDTANMIAQTGWGYDNVGGPGNMGLTLMRLVYYLQSDGVTMLNPAYLSAASVISWLLFLVTAAMSTIVFIKRQRSLGK